MPYISTMSFERIKKVNGHEYKYLVENTRVDGKIKQKIIKYLGRVDKQVTADTEHTTQHGINIPDGLYYLSQEGCGYCMEEEEFKKYISPYFQISGIKININYINLTKMNNPLPVSIPGTPTMIDVENGKMWFDVGQISFDKYFQYKFGDKYESIYDKVHEEKKTKKINEIKTQIQSGKKYRELCKMFDNFSDKELIKQLLDESKGKCKDGMCQI